MNASTRDGYLWPADYDSSRDRFRSLAQRYATRQTCHELHAKGPRQQTLSIDTARFGPEQARRQLIVSSGLHGVEGFIGAAVQLNLMPLLQPDLLGDDTAVVLIHAANPFGFAHLRRTNEDNIDLNRNFLDDNLPRPELDPGYCKLDPVLNPTVAPRSLERTRFAAKAAGLILTNGGVFALSRVIAQGQYHYPQGLFYGGKSSAESVSCLKQLISRCAQSAREMIHIDLHSGLGRFGDLNLIASTNAQDDDQSRHWLSKHLARRARFETDRDSPYRAHGSLGRWYHDAIRDTRFLYLCAEFGTYNPVRVLSALRLENQAHHWTTGDSVHYQRGKRHLLETFAPKSQRWRDQSITNGLDLIRRAVKSPSL